MSEQILKTPDPLHIPDKSLVVLIGTSGAGKSTFAATHFAPTQVLSSDRCRALVSDDEGSQAATEDAFAVLNFIAEKRLQRGLVTVIDATNVQPRAQTAGGARPKISCAAGGDRARYARAGLPG